MLWCLLRWHPLPMWCLLRWHPPLSCVQLVSASASTVPWPPLQELLRGRWRWFPLLLSPGLLQRRLEQASLWCLLWWHPLPLRPRRLQWRLVQLLLVRMGQASLWCLLLRHPLPVWCLSLWHPLLVQRRAQVWGLCSWSSPARG